MEEKKEEHHAEHEHHASHNHEHHKHNHSSQSKTSPYLSLGNLFIYLAIFLGILLIVNAALTFSINKELEKRILENKEKSRPAEIEITVLENSKCTDCFDISPFVEYIKGQNVKVMKERVMDYDSSEGKELVSKYKLNKVPALIVTGETEKAAIEGLEKKEDALVLSEIAPPYTEVSTGEIRGRVAIHLLKDPSCAKCNSMSTLISQLKAAGLAVSEEKMIDISSSEGKGMINRYKIDFAPAIILSKEAEHYRFIQQSWLQIGTKESDGSYVSRAATPPFVNLSTGKTRGIVNITYLTDKSCSECYDVNIHKQIITSPQSFAISLDKEETFDISDASGKELAAKYNITLVPTIILSEEVAAYPASQALMQFFSVEKNGYYVFRKPFILGSFKDMTTNSVVNPSQGQGTTA
ncbi:hypothetical protein HYS31_06200 [Candidatus Woesearchaeota archaeon]|nr:hypothetical protein [Candidatus Woesearchaeota archaeon]